MTAFRSFLQKVGIHPLAAAGLILCDLMLFGGEAATLGAGMALSLPVGVALGLASILLQRFSYRDDWGTAIGKGLILGVLTAIPTALPSVVTGGGGALGLVRFLLPAPKDGPALPDKSEKNS